MPAPVEPIYLVIRDAALRSSLAAWLGLSGHEIVASQDLQALVARPPAASGLFVIDGELLPAARAEWTAALAPLLPLARCVVLVAGEGGRFGPFGLADRRSALPAIQRTIARTGDRHAAG